MNWPARVTIGIIILGAIFTLGYGIYQYIKHPDTRGPIDRD